MGIATNVDAIRSRYEALTPVMDERMRRLWAAAEAKSIGWGGLNAVREATGISYATIKAGLHELDEIRAHPPLKKPQNQRVRRPGGGRKRLIDEDPTLLKDLESLVEPMSRGDPESPLRWTTKSLRNLAAALIAMGHEITHDTVGELLEHELDYSLQANRKTKEGSSHPDRDAQFEHINSEAKAFQERGAPVISVDAKKKELVGDFKNGGREWHPQGEPEKVRVYDFKDKKLGKVTPYGIYDIANNVGWVNVGVDHDTAEFAVESIRNWWHQMGRLTYPEAKELLITADGGGSNGYRTRLWKVALQRLADEEGLNITVCHYPPGTSKWNKIEHRMFSQITKNWRGRPLESLETVVSLIGNTKTSTGLRINAAVDPRSYETKKKISDTEINALDLTREEFHGEWNYSLSPRRP